MANKAKKRASGLRGPLTASSMASFARRLIMGFLFGGKASGWPIFQSVLFLFDPQTTKAQEKIAKPLSLSSQPLTGKSFASQDEMLKKLTSEKPVADGKNQAFRCGRMSFLFNQALHTALGDR